MSDTVPAQRLHRLYDYAVWPPRVAALTGMWLLGVLAGGIVLGLAPATVAGQAVALQWHSPAPDDESSAGKGQVGAWRTFWSDWRTWLWRSQPSMAFAYLTLVPIFFWTWAVGLDSPLGVPLGCLALAWLITIQFLPAALIGRVDPRTGLSRITLHLAWRRWPATIGIMSILAAIALAGYEWLPFGLPIVFPGLSMALVAWLARRTVRLDEFNR